MLQLGPLWNRQLRVGHRVEAHPLQQTLPAQPLAREAHHDAQQPRVELSRVPQLTEAAQTEEEGVLNDVFTGRASVPTTPRTPTIPTQPTGFDPVKVKPVDLSPRSTGVNTQHPWLQKLGSSRLSNGETGTCVATTLRNMDRLGVPSFAGGTMGDPNN